MAGRREPDILIAGGGSAGLTAALAIAKSAPGIAVEVVDAKAPGAGKRDERASAIAAAAKRMLEQLGVWHKIESEAQPILSMEITDSRTADVARPIFLTFDGSIAEGEPFAHMVANEPLIAVLREAALTAGVVLTAPDAVKTFAANARMEIVLASGETRRTALLVAADGIRSKLRAQAGIRTVTWSYPQTAIVATVSHERPHNGVAVEHFLPGGPFAACRSRATARRWCGPSARTMPSG